MCRWFTYLGEEPQLLEDLLLRPTHSIVKQIDDHFLPPGHTSFNPSHDAARQAHHLANPASRPLGPASATDQGSPNPLTNMDGFGVGWWSDVYEKYDSDSVGKKGLRPVVYKNTRPPLNDLVLKSLASGVETKAVVAHIRAGTGLTPVVETSCHPYTFGRYLFCHNGVLGSFHLFKTRLLIALPLRYQLAILGTTDSEHIAALYIFHLCGKDGKWTDLYPVDSMRNAMIKTLRVLEGLKEDAEEQEGVEREHNALNLLVNSGSSLVAVRYASPISREPPSLYYSTTAGAALNRKFKGHPDEGLPEDGGDRKEDQGKDKAEHGKHVIVASEPSTLKAEEWELIRPNHMISVSEEIEMQVEKIELGTTPVMQVEEEPTIWRAARRSGRVTIRTCRAFYQQEREEEAAPLRPTEDTYRALDVCGDKKCKKRKKRKKCKKCKKRKKRQKRKEGKKRKEGRSGRKSRKNRCEKKGRNDKGPEKLKMGVREEA